MAERSAFDRLFMQHYTELCIFAKRFVPEDAACEDIVSDAFEDVWCNIGKIEEKGLRPYLYVNVRNKCIDHLRRQATRRQHARLYAQLTTDYDHAERMAEEHERNRIVRQVLDALPDHTRRIFSLCYVDQHSYQEVADTLDISPSTVKKHVSRALRLIAEMRKSLKKV